MWKRKLVMLVSAIGMHKQFYCLLEVKPKLQINVCIFSGLLSFALSFTAAGPTADTSSLSFSPAVSEVEGRPISFIRWPRPAIAANKSKAANKNKRCCK